MNAESEVK